MNIIKCTVQIHSMLNNCDRLITLLGDMDIDGLELWCLKPLSTIFQSDLLMEEIRIPGENHRPVISHLQTSSH